MEFNNVRYIIKSPRRILIKLLNHTAQFWPDKLFLQIHSQLVVGRKINLSNPQTFSDKLQWLKLYNRKPEYTTMVDKYAVKKYVAEKIGEEFIIPTLGVWDQIEDIDWDGLPNQFVLKTTHGGGGTGVVICKDKKKFNIAEAIRKLQHSLDSDISINFREWPYKNVIRRIIAEKFVTDINDNESDLVDYKFFCFNGEPLYCQVIRDRNTKETVDFYDMEWKHMPFVGLNPFVLLENGTKPVGKPKCLDLIIDICKKINKNIPFTRTDFYIINGKPYFGEITFFPAAGIGRFTPDEWNYKLGDLIKLPIK